VTLFDGAAFALRAVVAALAVLLARRHHGHRPVAIFLVAQAMIDPLSWWLNHGPLDVPRPYTGALRVLFHADQAGFISWSLGIAAVCTAVFLRRRPWSVLGAGVVAFAALVVGYPAPLRGAALGRAYAVIDAVAVIWSLGCAIVWTKRSARPRPEQACALVLGGMDIALFFGPYAPPAPWPFESWSSAQVVYMLMFCALALVHMGAIWFGFMSSASGGDSSSLLH
jgi:hypothetical protein